MSGAQRRAEAETDGKGHEQRALRRTDHSPVSQGQ